MSARIIVDLCRCGHPREQHDDLGCLLDVAQLAVGRTGGCECKRFSLQSSLTDADRARLLASAAAEMEAARGRKLGSRRGHAVSTKAAEPSFALLTIAFPTARAFTWRSHYFRGRDGWCDRFTIDVGD